MSTKNPHCFRPAFTNQMVFLTKLTLLNNHITFNLLKPSQCFTEPQRHAPWCCPRNPFVTAVGRHGHLPRAGRRGLVDSWLAILALCAFDLKWQSASGTKTLGHHLRDLRGHSRGHSRGAPRVWGEALPSEEFVNFFIVHERKTCNIL